MSRLGFSIERVLKFVEDAWSVQRILGADEDHTVVVVDATGGDAVDSLSDLGVVREEPGLGAVLLQHVISYDNGPTETSRTSIAALSTICSSNNVRKIALDSLSSLR